jgi:hypothetical protein
MFLPQAPLVGACGLKEDCLYDGMDQTALQLIVAC